MAHRLNLDAITSPCFVIDKGALVANLEILAELKRRTGVRILMAQKAFSTIALYPIISEYLDGVCASGLWEATLGTHFGKEIHTYSPAYRDDEIDDILKISDHVVFNTPSQIAHFMPTIAATTGCHIGIRVNPQYSVTTPRIYDPCAPNSRLGTRRENVPEEIIDHIDGLHFHVLCEQDALHLEGAICAFEQQFGDLLPGLKWVNFGGGHDLTRAGYDRDRFIRIISDFRHHHPHLDIILEPGGAVVYNTGFLVATVLDVVPNDIPVAILDISCTCHTPDVLEMPYRPFVTDAVPLEEAPYRYRLGGVSCLAGDIFGDYGFMTPLKTGHRIVFEDMAHYTTVKTTMFNGIRHPDIAIFHSERRCIETIRHFTFHDFKSRLS